MVSGDEEYRSEEALPQLARILSKHHGFDCTVLFAQDPQKPGIVDPNYTQNIPGLEALEDADLLVLFTRFRDLPDVQMQYFQNYLLKGKPVIAIRTATHAFNIQDSLSRWKHWGNYFNDENSDWTGGFGQKTLGTNWYTHHGYHKHQSTRGFSTKGAESHPITKNIHIDKIWGPADVYGLRLPLPGDAQALVLGKVIEREGEYNENDLFFGMKATDKKLAESNPDAENKYSPIDPMMPIVWIKSYQIEKGKQGMALTSTIGASTDFLNQELRILFVNGVYFLLKMPVPERVKADLVGDYSPSQFSFQSDDYWGQKNLKVSDFVE